LKTKTFSSALQNALAYMLQRWRCKFRSRWIGSRTSGSVTVWSCTKRTESEQQKFSMQKKVFYATTKVFYATQQCKQFYFIVTGTRGFWLALTTTLMTAL
jgi:hypothetical protein